jgi:hypothetical protein
MQASGQIYFPAALSQGSTGGTHRIGSSICLTVDLDSLEKSYISSSCQQLNYDSSDASL